MGAESGKLLFIAEETFSCCEKKSGGWSVSHWLHSPWKFLKLLLLIQTLNVTMSNPLTILRAAFDSGSGWDTCMQAICKGHMGLGKLGRGQFLENCWFLISPSNCYSMGITVGSKSDPNVSHAAGDHDFILRGYLTSAHRKESIASWTMSHSGAAYQH